MKKLIIALLLLPICAISQISELKGIGIFKPGVLTYAELREACKDYKFKTFSTNKQMIPYLTKRNLFVDLVYDPKEKLEDLDIYASVSANGKSVYISDFEIAGIKLTDLHLNFFNDTLSSMSIKNPYDLVKALEIKYGKGEEKSNETPSSCSTTKLNRSTTKTWTNNPIVVSESYFKYNSSNCVERITWLLNVYDINKYKEYSDDQKLERAKIEKALIGGKLKDL